MYTYLCAVRVCSMYGTHTHIYDFSFFINSVQHAHFKMSIKSRYPQMLCWEYVLYV